MTAFGEAGGVCEGDDDYGGSAWHTREDGAGCGVVGVEVGLIDVWLMHAGQRDGSWHYRGGACCVMTAFGKIGVWVGDDGGSTWHTREDDVGCVGVGV
eukprot:319302-Rhodomonas_salina.1